MEFTIATLLSNIPEDKLIAGKALEKKLDCQDDALAQQKLQIALDALEKIGVIVKERGKYRRVQEDQVVEAKLRCSSKGFCFAIQDEEEADDIYIKESHLSNAWNGDRVLVKVIKEGSRRRSPEGSVKLILERANPTLLATVTEAEGSYQAVPLDDRLLFELRLQPDGIDIAKAIDHLVHVNVLRYPIAQIPPIGQITKILGSDAEAAADTDIVICKHDLAQAFSQAALSQAEKLPARISAEETKRRLDLRSSLTVNIELESMAELNPWRENAFSLEQTEEGNWRLAIHIADVAQYIEIDSELDCEAQARGRAVNLVKQVVPMLPQSVAKRCSLLPQKPSLAVSVLITLDELGNIITSEIYETIVEVDHYLTYQEVQQHLKDYLDKNDDVPNPPLAHLLHRMFFGLAPLVKAQRIQRGGFDINLNQYNSWFKDDNCLGAIVNDSNLPVRSLLSELAVLAGFAIGKHLFALDLPAIYCTQAPPDVEVLDDLVKLGANLKLNLDLDSPEDIKPEDYQRFTQEFDKSSAARVLHYILKSTLKPVQYSLEPGFHFGLPYANFYTQCLSPGQRYADLLLQRVIKAALREGRDRRHNRTKTGVDLHSSSSHGKINWKVLPTETNNLLEEKVNQIVPHLNERNQIANNAEKDLEGLQKAEKMKERTGKIFEGLITGVQSYGFFVEIEDLLVEGLVHVSSLKDDWYEYRSRHSCLVGRKNRIAYRLGDRVEVEVKSVDYYRQQIDLVTVGGGSAARKEDLEEE